MERRNFLKSSALLAIAPSITDASGYYSNIRFMDAIKQLKSVTPEEAATMDDQWDSIASSYMQSPEFINLENGYCSLMPMPVLETFIEKTRHVNQKLTYFMRREMEMERRHIKNQIAEFAGVSGDEVALVRNTTEALNILIHGIDLKAGEEVILSRQDYGSMVEAFEQKAKRFGTVNKFVTIPLVPRSKQEIIDVYAKAITPQTRMMLVTHMINITGQIMPVKELCELGRNKGIEVIVDGAHSFAQFDFNLRELDCDYFATSLHKWFGGPIGAGLLYVKNSKIEKIWPLLGDTDKNPTSIEKFEHIGTNPPGVYLSLRSALDFNMRIGTIRKGERLRFLKDYWVNKVKDLPGVKILTPLAPESSCAIATFSIDGHPPDSIANLLYSEHKIFTVAINNTEVKGVRVTPHVYTNTGHLDQLVTAIKKMTSQSGHAPPAPPQNGKGGPGGKPQPDNRPKVQPGGRPPAPKPKKN